MNTDIVNSISTVAENLRHLDNTIQASSRVQWWNTQWFSALIGAGVVFFGTQLFSNLKTRNKKLFDSYQWFLKQGTFSAPDGLLMQATITIYGTEDKPLAEKMVIQLRSHTRYWYNPYGRFRFLLHRYENSVRKIKNGRKEEVKEQTEYKEAQKRFKKVMDFVYKKTGENEWTS